MDEEHKVFEVACAIETAGTGRFEVKRTLSVVNAYAVCRNRGVLAPPVVEESHARKVFSVFEASIAVQNPEATALSLTSQRISYDKGDQEGLLARSSPSLCEALTVTNLTTVTATERAVSS